jgi:SET domain-containing protein
MRSGDNTSQRAAEPGVWVAAAVRRSGIQGRGVFAAATIRARQKLGNFTGELIGQREGRRRAAKRERIAIVELHDGKAIDGQHGGNLFRYLNHSCSPNTFIRILGRHVEFYALRGIRRGEELTCDYGESHHNGTRPCTCGTAKCRGFI